MDLHPIDARVGERYLGERPCGARRESASGVSDGQPVAHLERAGADARIYPAAAKYFRSVETEETIHPLLSSGEFRGVLGEPLLEREPRDAAVDHPRRPGAQMSVAR